MRSKLAVLATLLVVWLAAGSAEAAPITYQYVATVIDNGGQAIANGATVTGVFSWDPVAGVPVLLTVTNGAAFTMSASGGTIGVFNDVPIGGTSSTPSRSPTTS